MLHNLRPIFGEIFFKNWLTWLIKAMTNTGNNGYLTFFSYKYSQILIHWPPLGGLHYLKKGNCSEKTVPLNEPKYYFVIVNFKNVVKTLPGTFLGPFFVEKCRKVVWFCLIWGIYARFEKKMLNLCNSFFHITLELSHTI